VLHPWDCPAEWILQIVHQVMADVLDIVTIELTA